MCELSVIVSVLESYEVVRRQLLHLGRILSAECELILLDDGSRPSLQATCDSVEKTFPFTLHCTNDFRPWTQPRARNIGASLARSQKLLFFDIDHILTRNIIGHCLTYAGDKLHWQRRPAILDAAGNIVVDREVLEAYGVENESVSVHENSFMIRRELFTKLGGYDERFCGRYDGDDVDVNARYDRLCAIGAARPADVIGEGYVFPDPAHDSRKLFHSLNREAPASDRRLTSTTRS